MKIRRKIIELIEANGIYIDNIDKQQDIDLRDYILDSIAFISLIVQLEDEFGIEFPDQLLLYDQLASLNGFANSISGIIEHAEESLEEDDL